MIRFTFALNAGMAELAAVACLLSSGQWRLRHETIAVATTVVAHGLATFTLGWTARRIEATAERAGLPDWWVVAQAEKNRGKTRWVTRLALILILFPWLIGRFGRVGEVGLDGFWSLSLAYQGGAFSGEYLLLGAQERLLTDVEAWSGEPGAGRVVFVDP